MSPLIVFEPFRKISRLSRACVVTEKIDGSSGTVFIDDSGGVFAASRNRWITPTEDNYGFAKWVDANKSDLIKLGPGYHRGEWWGAGIQRGYGLSQIGYGIPDRRFSLFNVARWESVEVPPACCSIVPVLYRGVFDTAAIDHTLHFLRVQGSVAAPGFFRPEGIVIYHTAAKTMFKKTIEKDEEPKGKVIPITL